MNKITLACCALLLFAVSCKKSNDSVAITKENLAGNYKTVSIFAKIGTLPERNVTDDMMEPCQKDDITTLKTDGTYVVVDAGTQCNPPTDEQGTWDLSGNTFIKDGENFTITKFDGKTLEVSMSDNSTGQTIVFKLKLNKQ